MCQASQFGGRQSIEGCFCHLVPEELGGGWDVMKKVKRVLEPLDTMNPDKYLHDRAYGQSPAAVSASFDR